MEAPSLRSTVESTSCRFDRVQSVKSRVLYEDIHI